MNSSLCEALGVVCLRVSGTTLNVSTYRMMWNMHTQSHSSWVSWLLSRSGIRPAAIKHNCNLSFLFLSHPFIEPGIEDDVSEDEEDTADESEG